MTIMADGHIGYCLHEHKNSLSLEGSLGFTSTVTMIGSKVWSKTVSYQEFGIEYSMDGTIWNTYNFDLTFMVKKIF